MLRLHLDNRVVIRVMIPAHRHVAHGIQYHGMFLTFLLSVSTRYAINRKYFTDTPRSQAARRGGWKLERLDILSCSSLALNTCVDGFEKDPETF
jgi:hypothetical protein